MADQGVLASIRCLELERQLKERVSHLLRAVGADQEMHLVGHPAELILNHLPRPEGFPEGLQRYLVEWCDDLNSLIAALPPLAELGRLPAGRSGMCQRYPILTCLATPVPTKRAVQAQSLKGLVTLATLLPLAYDFDTKELERATKRAATHVRLACSRGELANTRPLDIWPSGPCTSAYLQALRRVPRPVRGSQEAHDMHREIAQKLSWQTSNAVWSRIPRGLRRHGRLHPIVPDQEPSDHLYWVDGDTTGESPDAQPELVVQESPDTGYAERPSDLEPIARRARWLSGEHQAPALWSSSTVTPIELQFLKDMLATLDYSATAGLVLALQLATSSSVKTVLSMTIGRDGELTPGGYYRKRLPESAHAGDDKRESGQRIVLDLALPEPLALSVSELAATQSCQSTLRDVCAVQDDSAIARQVGALLREHVSARLEARHLPGVARGMLHRQANDVVAYLVTGTDAYVPPVGASYYGCTSGELVKQYQEVSEAVFAKGRKSAAEHSSTACIGPPLPPFHEISEFVRSLSQQVRDDLARRDTLEGLVAAHNRYSAWLALFLFSTVGHRPVRDPLCELDSAAAGVAIISDKVISEQYRYRLVPLPEQLEKQLAFYEDHLKALSTLLLRGLDNPGPARSLGAALHARAFGSTDSRFPRIMLLRVTGERATTKGVRPGDVAELTGWPWPLNLGRRLIHSWLSPRGNQWVPQAVPSPAIKAVLGHQGVGDGGLHDTANCISPQQYVEATRPALEALARLQGWEPLRGLTNPGSTRRRSPASNIPMAAHRGGLGPELRAQNRSRVREQARSLAEMVLDKTVGEQRQPLTSNQLEIIYGELDALQPAHGNAIIHQARNLLTRYARQRAGKRIGRFVLGASSSSGASPYYPDTPWKLRRALEYEQAFLDELGARGRARDGAPSQARRIAEIVFAAALCDGLARPQHLRSLAASLPAAVCRSGRFIYVDLKDHEDRLVQRLVPSTVTRALIVGLLRAGVARTAPKEVVNCELRSLLANLGPKPKGEPYAILARMGEAIALWRLPPFLMRVRTGRTVHQPLHPTALHRLITGQSLVMGCDAELESSQHDVVGRPPDISAGKVGSVEGDAHAFLRNLHHALVESSSKPDAPDKRRSPSAARREIQSRVGDLFPTDHALPPIAVAIGQWTIYLARYGTGSKRELAPGTITRYAGTVARALAKVGWHCDFHGDESEREELYREALTIPRSGREMGYLAERLREFHAAHCDMHGVEHVDWTGFPAATPKGLRYATIVTPQEYEVTMDALLRDPHCGEGRRLAHAVMVILGYRLGARAGEACRVRLRDLILDSRSGHVGLSVKPSAYGAVKSAASTRMATTIEPLRPQEFEVLTRAMERASAHHDDHDGNPPILLDPDQPNRLLDRGRMISRIHVALRQASEDPSVRYHALRHSYVTKASAIIGCENALSIPFGLDESAALAARDRLADGHATGHEAYRSLTRVVGHMDSETTLAHYGHLVEFYRYGSASANLPSHGYAYASGQDAAALRQRRRRTGTYESLYDLIPIPEPTGEYATRKQICMPPLPARRRLGLQEIHTIVRHSRQGESVAGIARIVDLDVEQVLEVLASGQRITQRSNYPGVPAAILEQALVSHSTPLCQPERSPRRSKGLENLLRQWSAHLESLSDHDWELIVAGLSRWLTAYVPARGRLALTTLESLRDLFAMYAKLGVSVWQYTLRVASISAIDEETCDWLYKNGLKLSEECPSSACASDARGRNQGLICSFCRSKGFPSNRDYQEATYVLCTYVAAKMKPIP